MCKRLLVLDFDKTIIDDYSEIVLKLLLPENVRPEFNNEPWPLYTQKIYNLLQVHNVTQKEIEDTIKCIPSVTGMVELIKEISQDKFDIIIISDNNSFSISTWMEAHNITKNILCIISNHGKFNKGKLEVEVYSQPSDSCNISEKCLCKGDVLVKFLQDQKLKGLTYSQVIVVGDSLFDLCAMVRLGYGDLACCRQDYSCAKFIKEAKEGKPIHNKIYKIRADVCLWSTGFDILNALK